MISMDGKRGTKDFGTCAFWRNSIILDHDCPYFFLRSSCSTSSIHKPGKGASSALSLSISLLALRKGSLYTFHSHIHSIAAGHQISHTQDGERKDRSYRMRLQLVLPLLFIGMCLQQYKSRIHIACSPKIIEMMG